MAAPKKERDRIASLSEKLTLRDEGSMGPLEKLLDCSLIVKGIDNLQGVVLSPDGYLVLSTNPGDTGVWLSKASICLVNSLEVYYTSSVAIDFLFSNNEVRLLSREDYDFIAKRSTLCTT